MGQQITARIVGVDNDEGNLTLRIRQRGQDPTDVLEVLVPAYLVAGLMESVVLHGTSALAHVAHAWATGDCATCDNFRVVQKPGSGGCQTLVHCPDCSGRERSTERTFLGYPRRQSSSKEGA